MSVPYDWKYFSAGGFVQVRLETTADLLALDQLDQKMWVALACPVKGLEFDPRTLQMIDSDKDGRIRVPEILAAVKWAAACLKDPGVLLAGAPALPLRAINDATPAGAALLASARHILANLGKAAAEVITVEDTVDTAKIFALTHFNGDGVVPAAAAGEPSLAQVLNEIIACVGADPDRGGVPGVSQVKADLFFAEATAFSDWWQRREIDPATTPLGEATDAAAAAVRAVQGKIDDYFARCRLAAFDPRALVALNHAEADYLTVLAKDLSAAAAEVAGFPLGRIEAGRDLPLTAGLNLAWIEPMAALQTLALQPVLGARTVLTPADWAEVKARFAPYEAWRAARVGAKVEALGLPRVRALLAAGSQAAVNALIAQDKALETEATSITEVERLVRYHRDLVHLLHNFVSFRDFYERREKAVFQAGRLFLDQRSCDLCLAVEDAARHGAMAALSGTFLVYCDCTRPASSEKRQIVAAFTDGDSDHLMVGRNGVFYDRKGVDWDATITKIIDSPISLGQAFWSPYKKLLRMVEEQIAKRASAAEAAVTGHLATTAQAAAELDKRKPGAPPTKMDPGMFAAIGIVASTLVGAVTSIVGIIIGLDWWKIPLLFLAIILAISAPSLVIAALKLRKRNLGPLLDANGWAINARARINVAFGRSLTQVGVVPLSAMMEVSDPFPEKKTWRKWIFGSLLGLTLAGTAYALIHFRPWQKTADEVVTPAASFTNVPHAAAGTNAAHAPAATNAPAK